MKGKLKRAISLIAICAVCAFAGAVFVACDDTDEWSKWSVTVEPTCTEPGEKIRYKTGDKNVSEKEVIPALGHDWGEWHITTPPTHTSEGEKDRTCKRCALPDVADVPMIPTTYYIDIVDVDGNRIDRVYTDDDGAYELTEPTLIGYEFIRFKTDGGNDFPASGKVDASMAVDKKVTVIADFEILPTTTFAELCERAQAGAKKILLAADITVTNSVYIVGNTEITVEKDCTLTRGASFGGDMFIVGETESGENTALSGKLSSLDLSAQGGALVIDGNKANMETEVNGTAILVLNSATVTMGDGVTVKNCKKTANAKLIGSNYQISYPERIGGAAMIVVNGTFVMNGGAFSDNEVNIDEADSDIVGDGDEKDESTRASSCGGAIYANADITVNGGTFSGNKAARGGAIYSYRKTNVKKATFTGNTAGVYAGAIYLPGSQYSAVYLGAENADTELVVLDGNTAQKSGGAIFGQMKNSITVYGGTTFKNNVAIGNNGGAINTSGAVTVSDAQFVNNRAASKGGAIYMYYSDEELSVRHVGIARAVFDGNEATKGGAIAFSSSDPAFATGAVGVIGVAPSETAAEGDAPTEHVYDVIFRNNTAHATATDDPELPDGDQEEDRSDGTDATVLSYNGAGGAIYISRKASVTLYNALFENNTAERKGGAVYITSSGAKLTDKGSCYKGNTAGMDASAEKKTSSGGGGAVYAYTDTSVSIDGSTFASNKSNDTKYGGGAVYMSGVKKPKISHSTFTANSAVYNGGAIAVYGGTKLTLNVSNFGGETAELGNAAGNHGGAVYIASSGTEVVDNGSNYSYNAAGNHGGAVFAGTSTILKLNHSYFENNDATNNAGAVYGYSNSNLEIKNSTFKANKAHGSKYGGGAMYFSKATVNMETVTFTDNISDKFGGAFCAYSGSQVSVTDITATGNSATSRGGVIAIGSAGTVVTIYSGTATNNTSKSGSTFHSGSAADPLPVINIHTDHFTHDGNIKGDGTVNELTDAA